MKKFLSILLAAMLLLATAGVAFAADVNGEDSIVPDFKIEIMNTVEGHTYQAYQIFTGDYSEGVLSNIVWGDGVDAAKETRNAAEVAEALTTETQVKEFAVVMAGDGTDANPSRLSTTCTASTYADGVYTIDVEEPGYYLIMDKLGTSIDVHTRYIVKVLGVKEVNPKSSVPSVEKKVQDINDSTDTDVSGWQDSADHDVGDTVNYKITGTLPSTLADYKTYKYIFHDTMCPGLTYNGDAVVKVEDASGNEKAVITSSASITTAVSTAASPYNGTELTIAFDDLKAAYADLAPEHKIVVYYTCTLDTDAVHGAAGNPNKVYLEYDNNPNVTGSGDSTANTPEDINIVFTYKVVVNKVNSDKQPLSGAEFKLEKKLQDGTTKQITLTASSDGTSFTASGLDDGDYVLTEIKSPAGYNLLDAPIEFTVTAEHEIEAVLPKLTSLTGETDSGLTFTFDLTAGSLSADVVNQSGATLPETGGIGTTLFYLFGGLMTAGSALMLVVRRRAESEEE